MLKNTFSLIITALLVFHGVSFVKAQNPKGFTWQAVHSVNFGAGANHFTIKAASFGSGGEVELCLDAANGTVIGRTYFHHTGISTLFPDSSVNFMDYECDLKQTVTGIHNVFMNIQDYTQPVLGGVLKIGAFKFDMVNSTITSKERLHIYPPVPGLDPSPYYEYRIQKVSELNSSNLADVTNWETPFAWFTKSPLKDTEPGYGYAGYIGGWSHTYTNFEMDPNTPVVVKITRKAITGDDAPAGPITLAAVHPAHKVNSVKIINGEVYVTMSNPALVTVDIDGQLDTRDAPRVKDGWGSDSFPYTSRKLGCHAVSIFANAFIEDKPDINAPGVLVIKAGKLIPADINIRPWTTLYFEPGVHKLSADLNAKGELVERRWKPEDVINLNSNRTIYIPGDAIVYGNFTSHKRTTANSDNFRFYGHGTISGSKILFWKAWTEYPNSEYPNSQWQRAVLVEGAKNVRYEGITVADPANHSFTMTSSLNQVYTPNSIKWAKVIAWRPNSDATAINGHIIMEDCFFRTQDDGHYIGGAVTMRRIVFWHDVNGETFRGDFTTRRYGDDNASNVPKEILIEDIDVIYARGVFGFPNSTSFAAIGGQGGGGKILKDGVTNTGQMVHFRNINISDPKPVRHLFGMVADETAVGDLAGMRFENVNYAAKQTFGWKGGILGTPNSAYRNFVFDNVSINGQKLGTGNLSIPNDIATNQYLYDMTYRVDHKIPSTGYTLVTTATNGSIKVTTETGTPGKVTVTATPIAGYKFSGWSGALSGTNVNDTITINSDKAITANFSLIAYTITKTAANGTIILEPALEKYLPGTVVTLKAVGNFGYGLAFWGGDLSGSVNPATITMNGDKNVSATFTVVPTYKISTNVAHGSIILNPAGGVYSQGTDVTLTAKAEYGYEFSGWTGDLSGSENPATLKMNSDKNIVANIKTIKGEKLVFATNCGGLAYTSEENVPYQADKSYSGGGTFSNQNPISGTEDDVLYQTERTGNFSYNINLPNGEYDVILMFAEIFWNAPGQRVFNVSIEGTKVINQLDIFSKAGKNTPYEETHRVKLNDGVLNISFTTVVDNSKVSAIKIVAPGPNFDLLTSATNGSISLDPPGGKYDSTTVVALTAKANAGYKFSGWSGDLTGSANPGNIVMVAKKVIAANFVPLSVYSLTTEATNGSIVLNPIGGSYTEGTRITLTAIPNKGYEFSGWSGDLSGNVNPASIVMSANKHLIATFVLIPSYTITSEATNGSISFTPQSVSYLKGTSVTVKATPDPGYVFAGWSGGLSGTNNPQTIVVDADKKIIAMFNPLPRYTIKTLTAHGAVSFNPPGGSYLGGTSVAITATPDKGYEFLGWIGDISSTNNPLTIVMNANKNINAIFKAIPTYTLWTQAVNGIIMLNPEGGTYELGTKVTVTALPNQGYGFTEWSGDLSGSANPGEITMNNNKVITATFVKITGIDELHLGITNIYALEQNYPNPFSAKTTIPFQLCEPTNVKISIINSIGQEVVQLIDQQLPAGNHTVDWYAKDKDGSQVPVGIYLCRMVTRNQIVQTKKIVVTR